MKKTVRKMSELDQEKQSQMTGCFSFELDHKRRHKRRMVAAVVLSQLIQLGVPAASMGFTYSSSFSYSSSHGARTTESQSGSLDQVGCVTTSWFLGLMLGLIGAKDKARGAFNGQALGTLAGVALCTDILKSDGAVSERSRARDRRISELRRRRIERVRRIENVRSGEPIADENQMRRLFRVSNVEETISAISSGRISGEVRGTTPPSWISKLFSGQLSRGGNQVQHESAYLDLLSLSPNGVREIDVLDEAPEPTPAPECVAVMRRTWSGGFRNTLYCDPADGQDNPGFAQVLEFYATVASGAYFVSLKGYADQPISIPNRVGDRVDSIDIVQGPFYWYANGYIDTPVGQNRTERKQQANQPAQSVASQQYVARCNFQVPPGQDQVFAMPDQSFRDLQGFITQFASAAQTRESKVEAVLSMLRRNSDGREDFARFCAKLNDARRGTVTPVRLVMNREQSAALLDTIVEQVGSIAGTSGTQEREIWDRLKANTN